MPWGSRGGYPARSSAGGYPAGGYPAGGGSYVVQQEGNSFTLLVCPHLGGAVPVSHNALQHFPECHGAAGGGGTLPGPAGGGYPAGGYPAGGHPAGGLPCQGVPSQGGYPAGGYPGQVRMGGYPVRTT